MELINIIISVSGLLTLGIALYLRYKKTIQLGFSIDKWAVGELVLGIGIAFLSVSVAFFIIKALGLVEVESVSFKTNAFFKGLGFYAAGAAVEELLFRIGLLLVLIYYLKNIWVAILIQILLFGIVHLSNPSADYLTAFSNAIGGLMYSLALIYSGRIWMPFALHVFWNFSQSFWGFNVSGLTYYSDIFVNISPQGADYLSGGAYGLEGSIIGIAARFLVIALVIGSCKWLQNYNSELTKNQYSILPLVLRPTPKT
jgi:membrane protease YdiL (CAAX protease family)